jgi:hypothetical protein
VCYCSVAAGLGRIVSALYSTIRRAEGSPATRHGRQGVLQGRRVLRPVNCGDLLTTSPTADTA